MKTDVMNLNEMMESMMLLCDIVIAVSLIGYVKGQSYTGGLTSLDLDATDTPNTAAVGSYDWVTASLYNEGPDSATEPNYRR